MSTNYERVGQALAHLIEARDLLKEANSTKTLLRVRLAISSAKGAKRHARNEPYRDVRESHGPKCAQRFIGAAECTCGKAERDAESES